tara:strand:- start:13485 stop:13943 length:459 start_codon:yes stop_codon:yes gene_type:complete
MTQFYDILDKIKERLRANPNVFSVTYGDITKVDLDKTTIFPLSHLNISNATIGEHTVKFTLQLLCVDIVDYNKNVNSDDEFYGNDNMQDILNTQLQVVNDVVAQLRRGALFTDRLQVLEDVSVQPFMDRFENELAGWGADIVIEMPNDISIC